MLNVYGASAHKIRDGIPLFSGGPGPNAGIHVMVTFPDDLTSLLFPYPKQHVSWLLHPCPRQPTLDRDNSAGPAGTAQKTSCTDSRTGAFVDVCRQLTFRSVTAPTTRDGTNHIYPYVAGGIQ